MDTGSEPVDLEKLAILLQRRYNHLKEIRKLTGEAAEAADRQDEVTLDLILQMRGEALERCDRAWQEILLMGEESPEAAAEIHRLILVSPEQVPETSEMERMIAETRTHCLAVVDQIREQDRILNLRIGKERSIFNAADLSAPRH